MNKIKAFYRKHIRVIPGVKSYVLATAFIFLFGLSLTLVSWYADRDRMNDQRQNELNQQAQSIENTITNRLNVYEQILRGGSGLMSSSNMVTQDQWRLFVGQYDLQNSYPGISGVGYVDDVKAVDVAAYTERMRGLGYPDFMIWPAGNRPEYAPISYVQSVTSNSKTSIGYDILSDPTRAASAMSARDSGEVSISKKLALVPDRKNGNTNSPGFIMYVASYSDGQAKPATLEQRRAQVRGYVFAGFRADNFFKNVIENSTMTSYGALSVHDGDALSDDTLLYKTSNFDQQTAEGLSQAFNAKFFGQEWTLQFAGPKNVNSDDTRRSTIILVGGVTLSTVVASFLFLIMFTRARDIVYVKQKEAQQAKDDLLSLASHQLRTPATAVKQYLGMVLEGYTGPIAEKQGPALQKAYTSNERQLEIINQILYVAKADAGRLSISRSKFDINLLVNDIALDLEDTVEERNQKILIENSRKKLTISADEASMRMVIENLVSNASKYSHESGTITIKTGVEGDKIYISVVDQGVGISPQDYDKLFKKFSRIDNELSLQVGGSGIGLYIDKVLIELHDGTIKVDSRHGEGSTFTVYLPRKIANNLTDGNNRSNLK